MRQFFRTHWLAMLTWGGAGLALGALLMLPDDLGAGSTRTLFGVGLAIDLVRLVVGVIAAFLILRLLDVVCGINFKQEFSDITSSDALATAVYFGARILALFIFTGTVMAAPAPTHYDAQIQTAAERWMPDAAAAHGWQVLKAQYWQESLLDPAAVSPVGAAGIAQFMPGTWADVRRQMKLGAVSPHAVGPAIEAGAYYMARLRRGWSSPRPEWDRHSLALASYNAGMGNLLKAQRRCCNAVLYGQIEPCLEQVTGHHSAETRGYVQRIWRWHVAMRAGAL